VVQPRGTGRDVVQGHGAEERGCVVNASESRLSPLAVYRLEFRDGRLVPCALANRPVTSFQAPVTQSKLSKLYVIKHAGKIVYVGQTRQPMASRLRQGFQAQGEHGYHGYSWSQLSSVEMLVWCLPALDAATVEAVEAEIVYLVRHNTGQWPEHQTEIHFHCTTPEERAVARAVYRAATASPDRS